MKKVIIIGAGLAGLSLATELVDEGFEITILEKNPYLGGRASNTKDWTMHDPIPIGPHVFVTAYNNFRHFLKKIEAEEAISWEKKIFLEIVYKGEHQQFQRINLPPPFSTMPFLFSYKFIDWNDKFHHFRLANQILFTSNEDLEKLDNIAASELLKKYGVTENAINKFWRFFVLTMLNVPLEVCSAAELGLLIKHWVTLKNRMFGFTKVGLGDLYTKKAQIYITKKQGNILHNTRVEKIIFKDNTIDYLLVKENGKIKKLKADCYVSTLTPVDLRSLLPKHILSTYFFQNLTAFEGVPYICVNLWFDKKITDKKFWALLNDGKIPSNMNTDFYDQSNIYQSRKKCSFITSNIIYSKAYQAMSDSEIISKTLAELDETFPKMSAKLIHHEIHRVPYVIYAPLPGMRKHKLSHKTPINNFYLAGDWTIKELTQCMESAVRSGYKCAEVILAQNNIVKSICDDQII